MRPYKFRRPARDAGFTLIVSLIVIVLLTVIVVSFLSSMALERTTATAYSSRVRAQSAAEAAVSIAMSSLKESVRAYPDSATSWEPMPNGSTTVPVTALYLRAQANAAGDKPNPDGDNTPKNGANEKTFVLPLVSGASVKRLDLKSSAIPKLNYATTEPDVSVRNYVDINKFKSANDAQGWIGTPLDANGQVQPAQAIRVPWVEQKDSSGAVISRYAYWVEDESFRANANLLRDQPRGKSSLGVKPSEIPLQGLPLQMTTTARTAFAQKAVSVRDGFVNGRFLDPRAFNQIAADGVDPSYRMGDQDKYSYTIWSDGYDLSRNGSRRLNLNDVVAKESPDPSATEIRLTLDRIIEAINFQLPKFGQRFYRLSDINNVNDVQPPNDKIYLNKIAANIRDYIDTDFTPTIIMAGGAVRTSSQPTVAINDAPANRSGTNQIWAFGKEGGPLISEYMLRVKALRLPSTSVPNYEIQLEYYIELTNMTTKDIPISKLGGPFIKIVNQFGWYAGQTAFNGANDIPEGYGRDVTIPLSEGLFSPINTSETTGLRGFPANSVTVITTDFPSSPSDPFFKDTFADQVIRVPHSSVIYADNSGGHYAGRVQNSISGFQTLLIKTRGSTWATGSFALGGFDTKTEVIFANQNTYIDSQASASPIEDNNVLVDQYSGSRIGTTKTNQLLCFFRGGNLLGTKGGPGGTPVGTPYSYGDPRSNNEMLSTDYDAANAAANHTRFFMTNSRGAGNRDVGLPVDYSLGKPNTPTIDNTKWFDHPTLVGGFNATQAPAVVANAPMTSIGQLGDIYDPQREAPFQFTRGGGRSLAVGQKENVKIWDGQVASESRNWTAWRLADIFTTAKDDPTTTDIDESLETLGTINLNGVWRDNGAALIALLTGYQFNDVADPQLTGKSVDTTSTTVGARKLVTALKTRLDATNPAYQGPLLERGEVSELASFSTGSDIVSGVNMALVNDRAREEIVRRLIGLTTTRGSVFSVYALGQSVKPLLNQPTPAAGMTTPVNVTSTYARKVTFKLKPVFDPALPTDLAGFNPSSTTEIAARFAKPVRYEIEILAASDRF